MERPTPIMNKPGTRVYTLLILMMTCLEMTAEEQVNSDLRDHCLDKVQGGSNMTGTDLYVNKPHCAAALRP